MKSICEMTSREAMNLAGYYESGIFENLNSIFIKLMNYPAIELSHIAENAVHTLSERYVAATILGLQGDPRINVFHPNMIDVPGCNVSIGSTMDEIEAAFQHYKHLGVVKKWLLKEYPLHTVEVSSFSIMKYLVTNREYLAFLKDSQWEDIPLTWKFGIYDIAKSNHPVYGITPESADKYADWLSQKTKRNFRLPTEQEWEYAAAGLTRNEFPWGNSFSNEKANTLESKIYTTTPVGIYPDGASPFGCLDMAGNVEEFVSNEYSPYPEGESVNDDLGGKNEYRIARGGSFTRYADLARCRRRHGSSENELFTIGFRLAEDR